MSRCHHPQSVDVQTRDDLELDSNEKILKVFVLTGKRGGFGAMKPMLRLIRDDPAFELQLVVTDQHVSDRFGRTIREVEEEFTVDAAVDMEQEDDSTAARSRALGTCLHKMTAVLQDLAPDICILYGDRGEVLATATAATVLGIPIAHLQGGDVSGSIDEPVRHAITKLAHLHFPSTEDSAERIRRMGEEPWRITVVGDSHIDLIVNREFCQTDEVARKLGIDLNRNVLIVLQHSETTTPDASYAQMTETLEAVREFDAQKIVVHPCSDPGYEGIIRAIEEYALDTDFHVFVNLDARLFWGVMAISQVMIGNSSAGLIETPYIPIPAVNIGRRQEGRLRGENILSVPHERAAIRGAIDTALNDPAFRSRVESGSRPFGEGDTGVRVVQALRELRKKPSLLLKRMTY